MASRRDLRRFLAPLLETDASLELLEDTLFVGPFSHVAGIISFLPSSEGVHAFTVESGPRLFVDHMDPWVPGPISIHPIRDIGYRSSVYDFAYRDRFIGGLLADVINIIRRIDTCASCKAFIEHEICSHRRRHDLKFQPFYFEDILVGEFNSFVSSWKRDRAWYATRPFNVSFPGAFAYFDGIVDAIESGDLQALAEILHDREKTRVDQLGLSHLWKRTPFPFEEPDAPDWRSVDMDTIARSVFDIEKRLRTERFGPKAAAAVP
jgi:hypothetical protein